MLDSSAWLLVGVFVLGLSFILLLRRKGQHRRRSRPTNLTVQLVGSARREPLPPPILQRELWDQLSQREKQVVIIAARGMSNAEIAQKLGVTKHTIDSHIKHAYAKLGVHNRLELYRLLRDLEIEMDDR